MSDSSYKTRKHWHLPKYCGNCGNILNERDENIDIISRRSGVLCRHCRTVSWDYVSSEQSMIYKGEEKDE